MYLWRRTAETHWLKAHEDLLQAHAHGQLVIVRRPGRKRLELEIACRLRSDSCALFEKFGGRIEALPRNWLERLARGELKPIKIGKRLMIVDLSMSCTVVVSAFPSAILIAAPGLIRWGQRILHQATSKPRSL